MSKDQKRDFIKLVVKLFCINIQKSILRGDADIAVHSLKDVPAKTWN